MEKRFVTRARIPAWLLFSAASVFLDHPLALFMYKTILSNRNIAIVNANIPDILLPFVCVVSTAAWTLYFMDKRKGIRTQRTLMSKLIGISLPLSFLAKDALKFAFGRINTRYWLYNPDQPEFRLLSGSEYYHGFPSGHMAVFSALLIAMSLYYPRYRGVTTGLLVALSAALIATNYHFLSDVIAGYFLGLAVVTGVRCMIDDCDFDTAS
jgi:membrane-associated phospholipid phosphatase